jgi:23S rRNA pseudouridine2605 synthase
VCSRSVAARWIAEGRVSVGDRIVRDPEQPVVEGARITVDGVAVQARSPPVHLALNKPRGLVTTASDERGRDTVYRCFDGACLEGAPLPWIAPVGRLDKASEGLLLFTNDPAWAARITDPATGPDKTYHVQVDAIPGAPLFEALAGGVDLEGERLHAKSVRMLRTGTRNAWIEVVLDEGRNRHIRRLLEAFDLRVLRLVRVAIGPIALGDLPKSAWRPLTPQEVQALSVAKKRFRR